MVGGVVSTSTSELLHVALRPVEAETAVQTMTESLLAMLLAIDTEPSAFCWQ